MLETAQLTWVNLLDPSTTKNRNPHLRKKIRSHVTRLQHARKQGTVLKRHPQQPPIPCYCPDNALFVDYEAWPSKEMEECTQPIDQNEDEITNQCYEIFQRSGTTTFTSVSSFEGFLSFDYNRCPSPRLLLDLSDDLDVHLRRLGANVPEAFVSHPNNYYAQVVEHQGGKFEIDYSMRPGWGKACCALRRLYLRNNVLLATGLGLLRMRQFAINAIQKAMQEQGDALTDQLVLAVAYFVAYESIYGSIASYKVHLKGLEDMIVLRGGFASLGVDGLVEAVILYIDANAAGLMGCSPSLMNLPRTRHVRYEADKELFLSGLAGLEHHDVP